MVDTTAAQHINLAVVAGDGIGTEVVEQGLLALDTALHGGTVTVVDDGLRPGRAPLARDRRDADGHRPRRDPRARRDPAGRHRRPERAVGRPRARAAAQAAVRARPLREPAPEPALPGRRLAAGQPGRDRLRRRPRGHRGPVRRQRRRDPRGHPARGGQRGQREHRVRRRARGARRVRPRRGPSAQEAHARAQAQRARARRAPVAPHGRGRERRVPRRDGRLPARRRGDDLPGHQPVAVRRDRHRQPVRRHPHGPRGGDHGRHRPGRVGQHQPGPHRAEHVRARARLRAGHRRPGQGRPDGHRAVGRPAARAPGPDGLPRRPSRRPSPTTSPSAGTPSEYGRRPRWARTSPRASRAERSTRRIPPSVPPAVLTGTVVPDSGERPPIHEHPRNAHVCRPLRDHADGHARPRRRSARPPSPRRSSAPCSPSTWPGSPGRRRPAGRTGASRSTARCSWTRRPPSCTTRRRSSRVSRRTGTPTARSGRSGRRPTPRGSPGRRTGWRCRR